MKTKQRVGRLTAVRFVDKVQDLSRLRSRWLFKCDCGNEIVARISSGTKSCGCSRATHGQTRVKFGKRVSPSATYVSWQAMIARCVHQKRYIGILVCARWRLGDGKKSGFECFLLDMGERPSRRHTIDRYPNKKGNYTPSNCRWATKTQQSNNMSNNLIFTYRGKTLTLTEISREAGVPYFRLHRRVIRSGWSLDRAISTPSVQGQRNQRG